MRLRRRPRQGDWVDYHVLLPDRSTNSGQAYAPALVTFVTPDRDACNLLVFPDGPSAPWWRNLVNEGEGPGSWQWPVAPYLEHPPDRDCNPRGQAVESALVQLAPLIHAIWVQHRALRDTFGRVAYVPIPVEILAALDAALVDYRHDG